MPWWDPVRIIVPDVVAFDDRVVYKRDLEAVDWWKFQLAPGMVAHSGPDKQVVDWWKFQLAHVG